MKNITSIVKNLHEKLAAHFNALARHVILLLQLATLLTMKHGKYLPQNRKR